MGYTTGTVIMHGAGVCSLGKSPTHGYGRFKLELAVSSTVRRVQHLIHEELQTLGEDRMDLKSIVRQGITELMDELDSVGPNISGQALEHIHTNEIFLTTGGSKMIEEFFKEAAKLRKFQVIIAETAPSFKGQEMAVSLAKAGLDVTLIPDSAIFALMSRVNKVIIGAHAITANGGLVCMGGTNMLVSAAQHHSTPVVVCAGLHKLSPLYPSDPQLFTHCVSPEGILNFEEHLNVETYYPYYEYIPPTYLSLYITNMGHHPPAAIEKLVLESYL